MATLALSAAGAAAGGALLPGVSLFGTTVSGAAIGQAVGAIAGSYIDQALFGSSGQTRIVEGPRLSELGVMASTEGASIPRLYGRARLAGQMIWATDFVEEAYDASEPPPPSKGLAGLGGSSQPTTTRIEYRYFANIALAICEGPITGIGRVWADGQPINLGAYTHRIYLGDDSQVPDSLIEAIQGPGKAPAYRGTAYIVFERLPLEPFGNRLPQLSFEVFRAVDSFEKLVKAVTIIPGSSEFAYEPSKVFREIAPGTTIAENIHTHTGTTDWHAAIDDLERGLPNVARTSLVVSWFGNDLRAGTCALKPGVESTTKSTMPEVWSAAGLTRSDAHVVSTYEGRPAFGGTPSDRSVVAAIRNLKNRGRSVTFYPFVLMDVPVGNGLPDPYGGSEQATYPWRGRITLDIAPGLTGSADQTTAAADDVAAFVGTATPAHFSTIGDDVIYSGPPEWSFRRMILHYAHLCVAAGGVETFLIGSELRGLAQIRSAAGTYPFVTALVALANDVRAVLGPSTKITYAADWSEYFGHQPADGTGDVYFHLDPLWASPNIDAVGIDVYWPLSDWRDGDSHLDRLAGIESPHDLDYLKANIFAGEGYSWYYASEAAREAQSRTAITDGAGKPWVFRFKDIRSWWSSQHYNRPGGVESGSHTAWVPQSKPIWITELGCPAVDKGANQPNVFYDPKSSESFLPYFSRGFRDDLIQRRYIQAFHETFDPTHETFDPAHNPVSSVYGGRMVDPTRLYVYTWDARPYPAFPYDLETWADGGNWPLGHWLTGRIAGGSLAAVVAAILDDYRFTRYSATGLTGTLDGYVIDRVMSVRQALQPLELAYAFDTYEQAGSIRFTHRGRRSPVATLDAEALVETKAGAGLFQVTRGQETELPAVAKLTFIDGQDGYRRGTAEARRSTVASDRVATADLPIVLTPDRAQAIAERWLQDAWASRQRRTLALPPSRLAVEPTDVVSFVADGGTQRYRVTGQSEGRHKDIEALSVEPSVFEEIRAPQRAPVLPGPDVYGPAIAAFLDLPLIAGSEDPYAGYVAAHASPWPGGIAFYRSSDGLSYRLGAIAVTRATIGLTATALHSGPRDRLDFANTFDVVLANGALASVDLLRLLGGSNLAAVRNADGEWEVIQFRDAVLIGPSTYRLSALLRGQAGTAGAMRDPVAAGATFVLLDAAVTRTLLTPDEARLSLDWRYGPKTLPHTDQSYMPESHSFAALGLRPLSPAHVRGARSAGDLRIDWIRRTRIGGDAWEQVEVPLGEDREAYAVDIMDGPVVKRTIETGVPSAIYSTADQIADWGVLPPSLSVRVHQLSSTYGRGAAAEAVI
ncbi:MAG: glycoside hydrolase/phage tail family protein [Hyphomicrobiaceae bacterium]